MDAILSALKEEKKQAEHLLARYRKELATLPKGSFFIRKRNQRIYGYITYSIQGKIHQDYLGVFDEVKLKDYQAKILRKKKIKELIQKTERQRRFLAQSLKYARKKS